YITLAELELVSSASTRPRPPPSPTLQTLPREMHNRPPLYLAQIGNIYFLSVGDSLRWAAEGVAREELSPKVHRLLARLDREEALNQPIPQPVPDNDCA